MSPKGLVRVRHDGFIKSSGGKEVCAHPANSWHSASAKTAGVGFGKAEVSVLWEAGAALASHPAPAALSETKSWAADEKTDRLGERFGDRLKQGSSRNHPTRENEPSFLKNSPKDGGGGVVSWEVWRSEQERNQEQAGRGSGCLENDGGVWSDEVAGEIRQLIRVKWRAGCWEESPSKANRQGHPALAKPAQSSTAGLSNQGELCGQGRESLPRKQVNPAMTQRELRG